jgi:hypothetical protein
MSQQLQKECFTCHQQIYLSKPSPDAKGWIKTNLDGSEHIDPVKPRSGTYQTQQTSFLPNQIKQAQQEERNNAIAKAHEENIDASKDLAAAIRELATAIRERSSI